MNSTVKRTAVACLFMFLLLMGNVTYIGAVQAEGLKNDPRNARTAQQRVDNLRDLVGTIMRYERKVWN